MDKTNPAAFEARKTRMKFETDYKGVEPYLSDEDFQELEVSIMRFVGNVRQQRERRQRKQTA
jgi:hypothetical protein